MISQNPSIPVPFFDCLDRTGSGALLIDGSCRLIGANETAKRLLGEDGLEALLRGSAGTALCCAYPAGEPYPPEELPLVRAARGEIVEDCLILFRRHVGDRPMALFVNASPFTEGIYLSVVRDVTEELRARERLNEMETRFQAITEAAPFIVWATHPDGTCDFVNRAWLELTGRPLAGELGLGWMESVHPEDAESVRRALDAMSSRAPVQLEFRVRGADAKYHLLLTRGQARFTPAGEFAGYVGSAADITVRREMEAELLESHNRFRQLAARSESVREEERTRIAREVHDELGQMLTVLKMELETLRLQAGCHGGECDRDVRARIDSMSRHIDETIRSVRKISAELRPGILDHFGLAAAIEWQAGEFQERTGIQCAVNGLEREPRLVPEQSTGVFRIFQEILTNVARHAQAGSVAIRLLEEDGWLRLEVKDDGRGIEAGQLADPKSLGLLGMRERAALLRGSVEFEGARGQGTAVRVRIPLRAD